MENQKDRAINAIGRMESQQGFQTDRQFYNELDEEIRREFGIERLSRSQRKLLLFNVLDGVKNLIILRKKKKGL